MQLVIGKEKLVAYDISYCIPKTFLENLRN